MTRNFRGTKKAVYLAINRIDQITRLRDKLFNRNPYFELAIGMYSMFLLFAILYSCRIKFFDFGMPDVIIHGYIFTFLVAAFACNHSSIISCNNILYYLDRLKVTKSNLEQVQTTMRNSNNISEDINKIIPNFETIMRYGKWYTEPIGYGLLPFVSDGDNITFMHFYVQLTYNTLVKNEAEENLMP